MDSIFNESSGPRKVDLESHYKGMIADQNKQIYKLYGRVSDLLEEKIILESEVERLTQLLELE